MYGAIRAASAALFLGTMMTGYKTKLGAGLSIFYGVAGLLLGLHDSDGAAAFIVAGVNMLGIGHKLDKLKGER